MEIPERIPIDMPLGDESRGLLVGLGTAVCFLPLSEVIETMRPRPVETIAGMPPFVCGLSIVRGAPVPVVDLGAVIGASPTPSPTRFVTLRLGPRRVALAVGRVVGVRDLDEERLGEMPPLLRDASENLLRAVGTVDAQLLLVLRAGRKVAQDVWDALEAKSRS